MNWEAIGALAELVGAVAVIGSVLYAAVQIRGNSAATKMQTVGEYVADYNSYLRQISESHDLAALLRKGFSNFDDLPKNDQMRVHTSLASLMLSATYLYANVQSETTEEWMAVPSIEFFAAIVKTPGGSQWWSKMSQNVDPDFKSYIDEMPTPPATELLPWFCDDDA